MEIKNGTITMSGATLTITINLLGATTTSKSGKSKVISTTGGNISVARDAEGREIKLGLNLYK